MATKYQIKSVIYTSLVLASLLYRSYEQDDTGVLLSLMVLPLSILLYFRKD